MKVRLEDNSVRLRLKRPEVERLAECGRIDDRTRFGPGESDVLTYTIVGDASSNSLAATFTGTAILVRLPNDWLEEWRDSERIGFEAQMDTGDGGRLKILVEKDFKCLSTERSDEEDTYPHPREGSESC